MNQSKRVILFGVCLLALVLMVTGCGQQSSPDGNGPGTGNGNAPEPVSFMIGGSDSEVNVVTRLAEEFMAANPHVSIAVTGGGSGVGISSLIDGDIDIANSSRPMKDSEVQSLKSKQGTDVYALRFAVDGVAVIVSKDNPVSSLTVDQIGAIYRGDVTNWSQVGGKDQAITLYGRQSTSGTYVFFMELVVQGEYSPNKRNLGGNADIVEAVRADAGGIGYVAIGYAMEDNKPAAGLKALEVSKDAGSKAYTPTVLENVTSGNYPLTRPLYQYIAGQPEGAMLDFLLYEVGDVGQAIVLAEGFYPITAADKAFNQRVLTGKGPEPVSFMLGGSDSEVNVVTRLAEEFMAANPHVSIAVTGGGSGVGISSLIDGDIDIANSSRPMKDSEVQSLKSKQGTDVYAVRFAVDGVAVIVNENNPVSNLTVDQIGAIYRGDVTNWSQVGGKDQAITLYGRQSTSGTYVFFMELVVQGEYSPNKRNLGGNADIVEAVRADAGGIGYVAIGYAMEDNKPAAGLKALEVSKDAGSKAYTPTVLENVTSGDYPLTRPLYQYIAGKPEGAMLDFLLYEVGDVGQAIVLAEGFYPITAADKTFNQSALK